MRNIVVTGATGLLGSHLLPMLLPENKVWAISQAPPRVEKRDSLSWIEFDLSSELSAFKELLPDRIDAVIHLAQSPFFRDFPQKAEHVFRVNVACTQFLLQLAVERGCSHFVYASTGGVYNAVTTPFAEGDVHVTGDAIGMYPASKQCGELLVNAYGELLNVVNLRFFFIYGRGQNESMLIPRLVHSVRHGVPISLQGRDGLSINPVHASDAANAVVASLNLDGVNTLNVAGMDVVTLREIGELIGVQLGIEPIFEVQSEQGAMSMEADITRMEQLLGKPQIEFDKGLADFCKCNVENNAC